MQATRPNNNNVTTILMLPWLAHGHISPYLELAKRLIKSFPNQTLKIHLCSTAANLAGIRAKTLRNPTLACSITLVELHLPAQRDLPPHHHTTDRLPPRLMPALKAAFDMSSRSFSEILDDVAPDLLIYDFLQPWAPAIAAEQGVAAVLFVSYGASSTSFMLRFSGESEIPFPFPEIFLRDYEVEGFRRMVGASANGVKDMDKVRLCFERSNDVILMKTFVEIEGKYVDYLSGMVGKKILPVGHLVDEDDDDDYQDSRESEVMKWLNQRETASVVLVSFGSEYFLSQQVIAEIAHALEISHLSFIWVLRSPADTTATSATPAGFSERTRQRGMVVEWAPQRAVLRSGRVGAFVSHCGWGSVMESLRFGVPLVALPAQLDQPMNARLVAVVGAGVEVGRVTGDEVAAAMRRVVAERGGEGVRNRAAEMAAVMRGKGDEEMEEVVKELVKIQRKCENSV